MNASRQRVITAGRAALRLAESADIMLSYDPAWTERLLLRMVRSLYCSRLERLLLLLPPDMKAEILIASEKTEGPVQEFGQN